MLLETKLILKKFKLMKKKKYSNFLKKKLMILLQVKAKREKITAKG